MKILITGSAGFVGYHLTKKLLLETNNKIVGIDNINDYYDINLKFARLSDTGISKKCKIWNTVIQSEKYFTYRFVRMNLEDKENLNTLFKNEKFDIVCHIAAQAGVRYSLKNPYTYINSNILGFINILEACKYNNIKLLLFASSSSIYGNSKNFPYKETLQVDNPISLYAATKKSNELMAFTYHHLYNIHTVGLRFFTVYGPWGRPDMAYFIFAKNILNGVPIKVFNNGNVYRDFTYIDDIIDGIIKILKQNQSIKNNKPIYQIYNIGNDKPIKVLDIISMIENCVKKKAILRMCKAQPGDVFKTHADISKISAAYRFSPKTSFKVGIQKFVNWYKSIYLKIM